MAFTESNLLLTDDKKAQLTAALSNGDVADPLGTCIAEASSDVARLTAGFVLDDNSINGFTRALALFKAYSLCGPVPDDIQKQYDDAIKELNSIARGDRLNIPRVPAPATPQNTSATGSYGGAKRIRT
jgi:hypothetical protein